MKNLTERLIKEAKGWSIAGNDGGQDFSWSKDSSFLWITTEGEKIGFLSNEDIEDYGDDYAMEQKDIDSILSLKPGEMYDSDGGINLYVRIK